LAAELKARIMAEYRHQLKVFNDSAEAQVPGAFEMELLERRLRLKALRAQRLELYKLSRHHQIGMTCCEKCWANLIRTRPISGVVK
jgi:CPA1 family monovalent cation:H+ antiporter